MHKGLYIFKIYGILNLVTHLRNALTRENSRMSIAARLHELYMHTGTQTTISR